MTTTEDDTWVDLLAVLREYDRTGDKDAAVAELLTLLSVARREAAADALLQAAQAWRPGRGSTVSKWLEVRARTVT